VRSSPSGRNAPSFSSSSSNVNLFDENPSVREIAKALLSEDQSQIEYYEQITKRMVGRVLTTNRGITIKAGDVYTLNGFSELSESVVIFAASLLARFIAGKSEARLGFLGSSWRSPIRFVLGYQFVCHAVGESPYWFQRRKWSERENVMNKFRSTIGALVIGIFAVTAANGIFAHAGGYDELSPNSMLPVKEDANPVVSLSGNGMKNTRPFTVDKGWELQWDSTGQMFQVFLYSSDGELAGVLANQMGSGSGSSYEAKGGTFYLQINAIGQWNIRVVQIPR